MIALPSPLNNVWLVKLELDLRSIRIGLKRISKVDEKK
jgi:hypothetical protein